MLNIARTAAKTTTRFARDSSGAIALMTGIMFPLLVILAGGATDYTRAQTIKIKAQKSLDATVLSLALSDLTDDEIASKGQEIFKGWLGNGDLDSLLTEADFVSQKNGAARGEPDRLTGSATLETPNYFLGLFGKKDFKIEITSASLKPNPLPYEIALVLDVSGSMNIDLNGRPRITRLKEAATAMLDVVENQPGSKIAPSISVVPYSNSVNISAVGTGILDSQSARGSAIPAPGGEVWAAERLRGDNGIDFDLGDEAPASSPMPFVTATDIGGAKPAVRMQGPSNVPATYRAAIDGLTAQGRTAGHLGMIWGIYALSPAWSSVWTVDPKPYGEAQKIIVMLSDGQFNETQGIGAGGGNEADDSNRYFSSACKLAKKNGVIIYTVALSLDTASAAKLSACAAGSGGEMISADSAEELTKAFEEIGRKIGSLRLSS